MERNFPVRTSGDDESSDHGRIGEYTSRDDRNDGVEEITSKMFDLMGVRAISYDNNDYSKDKRNKTGVKINKNNTMTVTSDINEREIRIPTAQSSQSYVQNVDRAWGREIFQVHKEKREAILEELHGVRSRAVPETRETIRAGLMAMEQEISDVVASSSASGETGELVEGHLLATKTLQSKYVVAPEFRLRFLRAVFFDVSKASRRYFKCLNYMLKYYGEKALLRPLELPDLSRNQRRHLESGKYQVLLNRDRMGRRILLVFGAMLGVSVTDSRGIEDYSQLGVLAEDEETQLHGAVCVANFHGPQHSDDNNKDDNNKDNVNMYNGGADAEPERQQQTEGDDHNKPHYDNKTKCDMEWAESELKSLKKLLRCHPYDHHFYTAKDEASSIRWSAIHICVPDTRLYHFFKAVVQGVIPPKYRCMTKIHVGSLLECTYKLSQFGIPAEDLGMTMKSKSFAKFLRARESVESFRKDVCVKHGVEYYRTAFKPKGVQQQDPEHKRAFDDGYSNESTNNQNSRAQSKSEEVAHDPNFDLLVEDSCPGTDCPPSNYVVFGDRITYKYPANVAFRHYIQGFLQTKLAAEDGKDSDNTNKTNVSLRLRMEILDEIIEETCVRSRPTTPTAGDNNAGAISPPTRRFMFATYDKATGWYRYLFPFRDEKDRIELRKRISQTVRDDRKRTMKKNSNRANPDPVSSSSVSTFSATFQNTDVNRGMFDAKRLKTDHSQCCDFFDPCSGGRSAN